MRNFHTGGKLCSLVKTKPLAILHLFTVPCKEIKDNGVFFETIRRHHINYVQLSPLQECRLIENTNEVRKNRLKRWYLCYQPISNNIGNELHGNENDIVEAIYQFKSNNIHVIADIVLGHLRHVYTFDDNSERGIKYFNERDGMRLLLHMSRIDLLHDDALTIDHINKIKYSLYDVMYNLTKYYGDDFVNLETKILDLNGKDARIIINRLFNNHNKTVAVDSTLRDESTLLTLGDVKLIRKDLVRFRNEIIAIICDYLEIDPSDFRNEYYDILTAPYNKNMPFQLQWLYSMPKLNHNNKMVQEKSLQYLNKLAEIGVNGLRFDYGIGYDPDILARYSQYFYECLSDRDKAKVYIYHEIVDFGRQTDFIRSGNSLYKKTAYLSNLNYQVNHRDAVQVSYTSYANLYDTLSIIMDRNLSSLTGLSIDEDNVVVFSESHDTLWGSKIDDPRGMWYRGEQSRGNHTTLSETERIRTSMLMLCYFLSRSCRISLIYFNQINFDDVFAPSTLSYQIYNTYKPSVALQSNVSKCLKFRNFLILNEIGHESGVHDNWENDAVFHSVYISTKYIGSRESVATIFINFGNDHVFIPEDRISIPPGEIYIKYEDTKAIYQRLRYK